MAQRLGSPNSPLRKRFKQKQTATPTGTSPFKLIVRMSDALLRRYPRTWALPRGWGEVTVPEIAIGGVQTPVFNEDGTLHPAMNVFPLYVGE